MSAGLLLGSDRCRYSDRRSETRVRFAPQAREETRKIVQRDTERDGLETGGLLIGSISHQLIEVVMVSDAGPGAVRCEDSFRPDYEFLLAVGDEVSARTNGAVAGVGIWHSHPHGSKVPSPQDLGQWAMHLQGLRVSRLVAVIAYPTYHGGWEASRFVVRAGADRPMCNPA
jgi:integrative and conjugative element protein (TIGR02256 family)